MGFNMFQLWLPSSCDPHRGDPDSGLRFCSCSSNLHGLHPPQFCRSISLDRIQTVFFSVLNSECFCPHPIPLRPSQFFVKFWRAWGLTTLESVDHSRKFCGVLAKSCAETSNIQQPSCCLKPIVAWLFPVSTKSWRPSSRDVYFKHRRRDGSALLEMWGPRGEWGSLRGTTVEDSSGPIFFGDVWGDRSSKYGPKILKIWPKNMVNLEFPEDRDLPEPSGWDRDAGRSRPPIPRWLCVQRAQGRRLRGSLPDVGIWNTIWIYFVYYLRGYTHIIFNLHTHAYIYI